MNYTDSYGREHTNPREDCVVCKPLWNKEEPVDAVVLEPTEKLATYKISHDMLVYLLGISVPEGATVGVYSFSDRTEITVKEIRG